MSLQVWLPLNGNLQNKGLGDDTPTIAGTSVAVNNNGKIGKCYSFGTDNGYLEVPTTQIKKITGSCSVSFWFNIQSFNTNYATIFSCTTTSSSWAQQILTFQRNNNTSTYTFHISNGSSQTTNLCKTGTLQLNTWYHIVLLMDVQNGQMRIYQNGSLVATYNTSIVPNYASIQYFRIGKSHGSYQGHFLLNDFRLYDHCLSIKQIKQLSKGLILHYPLDDGHCHNILLSTEEKSAIVSSNRNNAYTGYWYVNTKYNNFIEQGTVLTVIYDYDFDMSTINSTSTSTNIYSQFNQSIINPSNALYYDQIVNNPKGTKIDTFYVTSDQAIFNQNENSKFRVRIRNTNEGAKVTISNIRLFFGSAQDINIIYDCSGYQNNGTLNNITYSIDTPKYEVSSQFNGTDSNVIISDFDISSILNNQCTISFWIKPNGENGARSVYFSAYNQTSWSIEKNASNKLRLYWNGNPDIHTTVSIIDNEWQYITIVKNGTSDVKVYLNGELNQSLTNTHNNLTFGTTWRLGRDYRSNDGTPYKGLMSDFRLYTTALSEEGIKELYSVRASGDRDSNFYSSGKFIEQNNLSRIQYNGINNYNSYIEFNSINSNIMPNSVIMGYGSANVSTGTWRNAGSSTMTKSRVLIEDSPIGKCYGFQNSGIQTVNDGSCYGIDSFPLQANTQYTISMWARIIEGTEGYAGYNIYSISSQDGGSHNGTIMKNYRVTALNPNKEWTRCWYTFTTNSSTTRNIYIGITTGETSVTTQMCAIKIEKGSVVTPWKPKEEDENYNQYFTNRININRQKNIFSNSFIEN